MKSTFSYLAVCVALILVAAFTGCSNGGPTSGPAITKSNFNGTPEQKAAFEEKMKAHFGGGGPTFTPPPGFNPQKPSQP